MNLTDKITDMNYNNIPVKNCKILNKYPIYCSKVYNGKEPLKIVGIRENQVELQGDFSGGTHHVLQEEWFDDDDCFYLSSQMH